MRIVILTDNMKELKFNTNEITLGREFDNLLQLDYVGVSRYHGKILKDLSSGKFIIEDNNSTNGIFVNGKKIIEQAEINDGDILQLNQTKIQVWDLVQELSNKSQIIMTEVVLNNIENAPKINKISPATEPITVDVPQENDDKSETEIVDFSEYMKSNALFGKEKKKANFNNTDKNSQGKSSKFHLSNMSFVLIVVGLVIICLMLFLLLEKDVAKNSATSTQNTTVVKTHNLSLIYTKEFIEKDNIYRFHLLIENNKAYFTIDDLKSQLCVGPIEKSISEIDLSKLRQGIQDSDFLKIKEHSFVGIDSYSANSMKELIVFLDDKNNHVKVENTSTPREFLDLEDAINNYILEADLPYLTLTSEELADVAKDSFLRAEDLLANYEANYGNLKDAIIEYNVVISYLEGFSPEPKTRKMAMKQLNRAVEIRNSLYKQLRAEYDTFISKKDFASAKNAAEQIMQLFDIDTREYEFFKDKSIQIDDILRKTQTKRR